MNYRTLSFFAAFVSVVMAVHAEQTGTDPIDDRLAKMCAVQPLTPSDIEYLAQASNSGGVGECLARAILFRYSGSEYEGQFRRYFAIDRTLPVNVLPNEEINHLVNGVMAEYKGRSPAEVMARVYLSFRRTGSVAKKSDGTELSLEVMFRASVFAAVTGGSKEQTLRLAAEADRK
jgi:hypothetical protein